MSDATCPVVERDKRCPNPLYGRTGYCNKHYQRVQRLGTPYLAQMPPPEERIAPGLPGERWLPVTFPGFDGYEISDMGRARCWKVYHGKPGPRLLKYNRNTKGYRMYALHKDDDSMQSFVAHRLVMTAFVGPRPDGMEVRHLDGNKDNNNLTNLAYGTASQNTLDTVEHGTHPMARKTHCKNGHEFTPENIFRKPNGGRGCKECRRIVDRKNKERLKQERRQRREASAA